MTQGLSFQQHHHWNMQSFLGFAEQHLASHPALPAYLMQWIKLFRQLFSDQEGEVFSLAQSIGNSH